MPVKDASDVAGGVDLLRLTLEEEGVAQQLVVLGPLALFLFHDKDFWATYGQFNINGPTPLVRRCNVTTAGPGYLEVNKGCLK